LRSIGVSNLEADRSGQPIEKDLAVCLETISGAQLRGLRGEIRFERPPTSAESEKVPASDRQIGGFAALAKACNRFYLKRVEAELEVLRRLSAGPWLKAFEQIINSLAPTFSEGQVMLLKVGRHSGAESVTLDRLRWIQIRGGRGQSHWAREATTIWLAAEGEGSSADMRPFGWLLVERADTSTPEPLERWCKEEGERLRRSARENTAPRANAIA
jgi:CRISPR-associated protein Csm5